MSDVTFSMVDVFSDEPFLGNPVAVWHCDAEPDVERLSAFARWTNLSESTVLLPPTLPQADYRTRIFTPEGELPFAGHPTLGTCAAWLAAGGRPKENVVVQECPIGLLRIRVDGDRLAFAAPPLMRSGEPDAATLARAREALGLHPDEVVAASWIVNGPCWLGLLLRDAERVLSLAAPARDALDGFELGVIGPWGDGGPADYEVRAFCPEIGVGEDPVTGSLNAGLAQWLISTGLAPEHYTIAQGTALGRRGRLDLRHDGADVWVGGAARVLVSGRIEL